MSPELISLVDAVLVLSTDRSLFPKVEASLVPVLTNIGEVVSNL